MSDGSDVLRALLTASDGQNGHNRATKFGIQVGQSQVGRRKKASQTISSYSHLFQ